MQPRAPQRRSILRELRPQCKVAAPNLLKKNIVDCASRLDQLLQRLPVAGGQFRRVRAELHRSITRNHPVQRGKIGNGGGSERHRKNERGKLSHAPMITAPDFGLLSPFQSASRRTSATRRTAPPAGKSPPASW